MDEFFRRELDRLYKGGLENNAPWEFTKRRLRALGRGFRETNITGAPSDSDIEQYLEEIRHAYEIARSNGKSPKTT